ncbi:hypothetical protein L3I75_001101 [Vibrio vulnificus]|uniref:hypothetical protein n=1 Tax=Vibrio vulnificus TaxID=672 RepID=UPI0012F890D5|nr:hypothetical protein [Vibrio vulnificus]EGQ7954088.1 hypothetical protein [Vibrio vulnificus]EGQ7984964.1 hypothetical protein [Vibrio vulnificus]EGQ9236037.1 hypothetical protein [Vibrio vulnificus]EGQ9327020.1 hypothetical protein [Vibrio vulnificus]EGQ9782583.1 hypothetical protein [Vibrio vulnificus]
MGCSSNRLAIVRSIYSMASGITQWPVALLSGTVNRAKMLSRDWFGMALVERQRHTLKGTS